MKWQCIFAFLFLPMGLMAQLTGPYATTFNGNGHLVLEFDKDSIFTYQMMRNQNGEKGRGTYAYLNDTLTFNFIPFLDSGNVDCSFHRFKKDSGQIAPPTPLEGRKDTTPPKDSMFVLFKVMDCQTGLPIEEVGIEVVNKKKNYPLGQTDTAGVLKVKLTHNIRNRFRLTTNSPSYHPRQFNYIFDWNSEVELFLYQAETTVLEEGITKQFLVNGVSNKNLEITPIPTENKASIVLLRGKNLKKINKIEYKAYQKALEKGDLPDKKEKEEASSAREVVAEKAEAEKSQDKE
ncbi:MAG: hypothetical protein MRZ79_19405 [Bacteroidia bacterium]|nr:hypothetical protein [Bacteroidia bacterium]